MIKRISLPELARELAKKDTSIFKVAAQKNRVTFLLPWKIFKSNIYIDLEGIYMSL
jgi:hypothetical protein